MLTIGRGIDTSDGKEPQPLGGLARSDVPAAR